MKLDSQERMWSKVAAVVLLVSFLIFLIGFGSPSWAETNTNLVSSKQTIGLWRRCTKSVNGKTHCTDFVDYRTSDWLKASQSFMTLAFFMFLASIAVSCVAAFVGSERGGLIRTLAIAVIAVTMAFQLIGVGVFGGRFNSYFNSQQPDVYDNIAQPSWGLGVSAASIVLTAISLGMFIFETVMDTDE